MTIPLEAQGEIRLSEPLLVGWDEGVPPLRLDVVNRLVLGEVRFRFADQDGNPLVPGEPAETLIIRSIF